MKHVHLVKHYMPKISRKFIILFNFWEFDIILNQFPVPPSASSLSFPYVFATVVFFCPCTPFFKTFALHALLPSFLSASLSTDPVPTKSHVSVHTHTISRILCLSMNLFFMLDMQGVPFFSQKIII